MDDYFKKKREKRTIFFLRRDLLCLFFKPEAEVERNEDLVLDLNRLLKKGKKHLISKKGKKKRESFF